MLNAARVRALKAGLKFDTALYKQVAVGFIAWDFNGLKWFKHVNLVKGKITIIIYWTINSESTNIAMHGRHFSLED